MFKIEPAVLRSYEGNERGGALEFESTLCELFHENTKLTPLSSLIYGKHTAAFSRSKISHGLMAAPYKVYSLGDRVELPPAEAETELEQTIFGRRSQRKFTGEAITREELSRLLFFTYGRTHPGGLFRAVPSGGGLYPLEIYIVPNNVSGMEKWLYHYNIEHHCLDVVARRDKWPGVKECVGLQDMADPDTASMILFVTAILQRTTMKYLDRGYRMILIEAGEVLQNLSLLATSLGLAGYPLGGFIDNALSDLLEIDGVDEVPLLPVVLGRPPINGE